MSMLWTQAFWRPRAREGQAARPIPPAMVAGVALLAASTLGLGLAIEPAVRLWGTHPSWSRLIGSPRLYPDIEERLADLLGAPDTLLLPTDISYEIGCLVGCGVPTGWGSAVYAAGVRAGDTVVVYGAGGVGSNAVQGARYAGAKNVVVVDPVEFKRDMAKVFGATHTFADAKAAHDFVVDTTHGQLADHAICTPGVLTEEIVSAAAQVIGKGGKVTITAVGKATEQAVHVHAGLLISYQRQLRGALFGDCNPLYDVPRLLGLYRSGDLKLDELITRRYRLDEVNAAYQDMLDGKLIRGVIVHEH